MCHLCSTSSTGGQMCISSLSIHAMAPSQLSLPVAAPVGALDVHVQARLAFSFSSPAAPPRSYPVSKLKESPAATRTCHSRKACWVGMDFSVDMA